MQLLLVMVTIVSWIIALMFFIRAFRNIRKIDAKEPSTIFNQVWLCGWGWAFMILGYLGNYGLGG